MCKQKDEWHKKLVAELELDPRHWSVKALMMLSCPVHREQSLLHIKKTYACQKTYKSKDEIPLEGIWLRLKNREDGDCGNPFAPTESDEGNWRWTPRQMVTLKEEPTGKLVDQALRFTVYISFKFCLPCKRSSIINPVSQIRNHL